MAVVAVVSVEKLGCRDTGPPAPSLTCYDSVWNHPCLFQPSVLITSDALYTPYLAPFCSSFLLVPTSIISLVGSNILF